MATLYCPGKKQLQRQRKAVKRSISCDDALAEYLIFVSKITNERFYSRVLAHALLYRDCLNEHGPQ